MTERRCAWCQGGTQHGAEWREHAMPPTSHGICDACLERTRASIGPGLDRLPRVIATPSAAKGTAARPDGKNA